MADPRCGERVAAVLPVISAKYPSVRAEYATLPRGVLAGSIAQLGVVGMAAPFGADGRVTALPATETGQPKHGHGAS